MEFSKLKCRHCTCELKIEILNLGKTPPSNSYLKPEDLNKAELYYPLNVFVCENCFLVQVPEYKSYSEIFTEEYAYFSSYSKSWLDHSFNYVKQITSLLSLDKNSFVIEIASNDGYLLKNFKNKNIPCLGIEPTLNTANKAREIGIETISEFFTYEFSKNLKKADLIICNNVLAHVPDINDFVKGLKNILKQNGTVTIEFPHLKNLIENLQFDTIYHEHYSYLSLYTTKLIFESFGLSIYKVEKLETHGGSLRIYVQHQEFNFNKTDKSVSLILNEEKEFGVDKINTYLNFKFEILKLKSKFFDFLVNAKCEGNKIIAYGAAAKGNTFLNYFGIGNDLIDFVVDVSEFKQGKFLPGTNIPILNEKSINEIKPDYILILPWNIKDEIINQLEYVKKWNSKFIIALPYLKII